MEILKPADIRPFPKAGERKTSRKSRLGRSRIYTTSSEKERVEELEQARRIRANTKGIKRKLPLDLQTPVSKNFSKDAIKNKKKSKTRSKHKRLTDSSSSDSDGVEMKTMTRKNKLTISSSDTDIVVTSDHDDFDKLIGNCANCILIPNYM